MAVAGDETSGASGSGLPVGASAVASNSTGLVGAASAASASSLKTRHSIFIRTVSSYFLLSTLLIQLKLVYGPFGQSNKYSTLDFCPRPARKETNVPISKRS